MADAEFLKEMKARQDARGVPIGDKHTVAMPEQMWQAMQMLADMHHTSISEQVRLAVEARLLRHGIEIRDGEVVPLGPMQVAMFVQAVVEEQP